MSESYRKVTVIVESEKSIETTTFHQTRDFSGRVVRPEPDGFDDNMPNIRVSISTTADITLNFTADFDKEAGNLFESKTEMK